MSYTNNIVKMANEMLRLLALMILILGLCGCIGPTEETTTEEKIKVMTSTVPLSEFAERIGGDRVDVSVLIPPGAEPHTFEPTPSQIMGIADADLYIKNGAGLEIWMDRLIKVNKDMAVVDSSRGVDLIRAGELNSDDLHESILIVDPHIWLSPKNAMIQVGNICDGLLQIDPTHEDYYVKNRDAYLDMLSGLDEELYANFKERKSNKFIVLHPAWSYFARDYGLDQISIRSGAKDPGPKYLITIVEVARVNNISTIFVDPNFNPKSAQIIAGELKGGVVALDPFGDNYIENMEYVGSQIVASLGP